jgi:preprotein translocase subunit YajC
MIPNPASELISFFLLFYIAVMVTFVMWRQKR